MLDLTIEHVWYGLISDTLYMCNTCVYWCINVLLEKNYNFINEFASKLGDDNEKIEWFIDHRIRKKTKSWENEESQRWHPYAYRDIKK